LTFLALGADVNTAVYRVEVGDANYFLKLRKGDFDEISVAVPHLLSQRGQTSIIAPLGTQSGLLWGTIRNYRMILYPFVAGQNGYERALTPEQWLAFGAALNAIHAANLPPDLRQRIPRETFSTHWRERVRDFQNQVEAVEFADPIAAELAAFMRVQRSKINQLVNRAEQLAGDLRSRTQSWVLCHADIHPGNLLLPPADPAMLYIVDWDNPLYAPRERDLALVGGTYAWCRAEDARLFYHGYRGAVPIHGMVRLTYKQRSTQPHSVIIAVSALSSTSPNSANSCSALQTAVMTAPNPINISPAHFYPIMSLISPWGRINSFDPQIV
jgi:spectinomycin phosphotransferase